MAKIKRLFDQNEHGNVEQFFPVTHWSAIEGKKEILNDNGSISVAGLASMQRDINQLKKEMLPLYPFNGKRFAALGDSTTYGTSINGVTYSWVPYITDLCWASESKNFGCSGSRITKLEGQSNSFVERCPSIAGYDCVSIFGGVNDFNYNAPLGAFGDSVDTTFFGALNTIILTVAANNPNAKIFCMTPMKTNNVHDTFETNDLGFTLLEYVDAMKQVADYYSIPVLDLYTQSSISPYIPEQRAKYMNDGTHLNEAGQKRLVTQIGAFINNL